MRRCSARVSWPRRFVDCSARVSWPRRFVDLARRGSPDPADSSTAGLPVSIANCGLSGWSRRPSVGDLAGTETRAEPGVSPVTDQGGIANPYW